MLEHGFIRVATASPLVRVGDCSYNAQQTIQLLHQAERAGVDLVVFPELGLTSFTCLDLFFQMAMLEAAVASLQDVCAATKDQYTGLAVVGVPLIVEDRLYNTAAVLAHGQILGLVPKSYLPNYKEFQDQRYFRSGLGLHQQTIMLAGQQVPWGTDLLFQARDYRSWVVGVEICEDLWVPVPPSSWQCLQGANVIANLSASNELIGKAAYRRQLVLNQSSRCLAGYLYASSGMGESTQDTVFGGHGLIAENGLLLAESPRYSHEPVLTTAEIDLDRLQFDRIQSNTFAAGVGDTSRQRPFRRILFDLRESKPGQRLSRVIDPHPFVPSASSELRERCEEIFQTTVHGLGQRLCSARFPPVAIGVSGGLDSTLALLVLCKTYAVYGLDPTTITAMTMPGFGTTERTHRNALALMAALAIPGRELDIRSLCYAEMKVLNHKPFGIDLAGLPLAEFQELLRGTSRVGTDDLRFENIQARVRTNLLMNSGFVIGTGDLSELALGWCTYNGDHMSMYNPNAGIPKTLVKFLVRWAAMNEFQNEARTILLDIVETDISPELLPQGRDGRPQSTEATIGPYELHDFFLYWFLRFGMPPSKILYLADHATFDKNYTPAEKRCWLAVFLRRFFGSQFKRSCLPDGPKVGSVSFSPRSDWRMPSDAQVATWLREIERDTNL